MRKGRHVARALDPPSYAREGGASIDRPSVLSFRSAMTREPPGKGFSDRRPGATESRPVVLWNSRHPTVAGGPRDHLETPGDGPRGADQEAGIRGGTRRGPARGAGRPATSLRAGRARGFIRGCFSLPEVDRPLRLRGSRLTGLGH